ncbi:hypothetical protein OB2597_15450 [Pseudooceanicola batsensis HTCC2597]|uniref:FAD assembly factor SdhE n=1 Tax=Pseudooceanicola batsensis (strain ATCC BAA-863 / DSM 15984 / KCTC 12145 / HTCC2597) TaxID=252305 RepID=A3TYX2_PSEBH|nr:succinate dehydrogenase assembly factor 2 [Pseudooceanicola batsensis]EAQ02790.1 hypothetical protein OB2597_15450 [Pseudooceanicola batsensis HTCC2597]
MTDEPRDIRLRRMRMRSMRRGMKEMDILLMRFAEAHLAALSDPELDIYDEILGRNDQDLYRWITGQAEPPAPLAQVIARIAAAAENDPVAKRPA